MCHSWRQFIVSPLSRKCHFCWQGVSTACCWRLITARTCLHWPATSRLSLQNTHTVKMPAGGRGDRINHCVRSEGVAINQISLVSKSVIYCLSKIWEFSNGPTESHISGEFTLIRQFLTALNDNQTCWSHLANYKNSMVDDWLERKKNYWR